MTTHDPENFRTQQPETTLDLTKFTDTNILTILIALVLATSIGSIVIHGDFTSATWWESWLQNFSTEMLGAFLTFILLEMFLRQHRETEAKAEQENELKARLIRQMGSSVNDEAKRAAEELRAHGWLTDGSLQGANLVDANLQRANLGHANLAEADLLEAKLERANLFKAKLEGANLLEAKLEGADLGEANLQRANLFKAKLAEADLRVATLQEADLGEANLQGANLRHANLEGADLQRANLEGAKLSYAKLADAKFSDDTSPFHATNLPDGTHWTSDTDMSRFTDRNHPNFWEPHDPNADDTSTD